MVPTLTLNDGHSIPSIGFGTYPLRGDDGEAAILSALRSGYRVLDTAVNYDNEEEVGRALATFLDESGVAREDLTIQTKVPGRHHDFDLAIASAEQSRKRLGVDMIDVLLIHWPNPSIGKYREAWRALVEARERGIARSIGVSNFTATHLAEIIDDTGVVPAVNQIELHPLFAQEHMRAEHQRLRIITESWSPLGKRNAPYAEAVVVQAAAAHAVTPAQVILRWHIQLGNLPLPKSADPARQEANLNVFSFELTDAEVAAISALSRADGRLFDGDPDTHEEM